MQTLVTYNETFNKMSNNIKEVNRIRNNTVQSAINFVIAGAKDTEFTNKRKAHKYIITTMLDGDVLEAYTKRSLKIAEAVLVDGYKIKKELLSLAQMEKLIKFNKNVVNRLMELEGDEYIAEIKELFKSANIERKTMTFSARKAKEVK